MSGEPPDAPSPKYRRVRYAAGGAVLLLLVAGGIWVYALADAQSPVPGFGLSAEAVKNQIRDWGAAGVAGSILLMILHSFVPFPAEIVAMANGMAYGPLWGTVVTWVGAMLGAYLAFGLARWLGRPFVLAMVARRYHERVDYWTARRGGVTLMLSRLVPVISFNLINYAAGLTAISWWTFTWATAIGILPITFLSVLMGHGLWAGERTAWLWFIAAAAAGCIIWWAIIVRGRRRDGRPPPRRRRAG